MKKKWFLAMILCLVPLVFFRCEKEAEQLPSQTTEPSIETSAPNGSESGEQFSHAFIPDQKDITEDDSCYMFYYTIAANGMPVSRSSNGVYGDGSLISGTELVACYSRDGLVGLFLEYQPLVQTQSEVQAVIPLQEILKKERAKYDAIITQGDYLIHEICLEYIVQPVSSKDNAINLIPVCRFYIEHSFVQQGAKGGDNKGEDFLVKESTWDIFNAVTGEMLPFSQ